MKAYKSKDDTFNNGKEIIYNSSDNDSSKIFDNNGKDLEQVSIVKLLNYIENIDIKKINENLPTRYRLTTNSDNSNDNNVSNSYNCNTFLMPIQFVHNITGVGLIVIGKVISGQLQNGDKIDLLGMTTLETKINSETSKQSKFNNNNNKGKNQNKNKNNNKQKMGTKEIADSIENLIDNEQIISGHVSSLKLFNKPIKYSIARDYLGINISLSNSDIKIKDIKRGMVVCKQQQQVQSHNSEIVRATFRFYCKFTLFNVDYQGIGRTTPIHSGFKPLFYFLTNDITGEIDLPQESNDVMMPGDTLNNVKVTLMNSAVAWEGLDLS